MEQIISPIAYIRTDFPGKFGIPRQSGLVPELKAEIVFEPEFRNLDYFRGIEEYSHLWLIWQFSASLGHSLSPTVRPPRLGGNKRVGVFATRSPFRPNSLGLSCVKLEGVYQSAEEGMVLRISGADLMDHTPIFDIKPYLPYVDSVPGAIGSFSDRCASYALRVVLPSEIACILPQEKSAALMGILAQDPRPSYQEDAERIYGLLFGEFEVKFRVAGQVLTVLSIEKK